MMTRLKVYTAEEHPYNEKFTKKDAKEEKTN